MTSVNLPIFEISTGVSLGEAMTKIESLQVLAIRDDILNMFPIDIISTYERRSISTDEFDNLLCFSNKLKALWSWLQLTSICSRRRKWR